MSVKVTSAALKAMRASAEVTDAALKAMRLSAKVTSLPRSQRVWLSCDRLELRELLSCVSCLIS